MLSRILQSINTNVRELSGRQKSPHSPISAKTLGSDEKDYDSGITLVQGLAQQDSLAVVGDDKPFQPLLSREDAPVPTQIPDATVSSHTAYLGEKVIRSLLNRVWHVRKRMRFNRRRRWLYTSKADVRIVFRRGHQTSYPEPCVQQHSIYEITVMKCGEAM